MDDKQIATHGITQIHQHHHGVSSDDEITVTNGIETEEYENPDELAGSDNTEDFHG